MIVLTRELRMQLLWYTLEDLRAAMVSWIQERMHEDLRMNRERRHVYRAGLVGISPVFDLLRGRDGIEGIRLKVPDAFP